MKHAIIFFTLSLATLSTATAALYVEGIQNEQINAKHIPIAPFANFSDAYERVPGLTRERFRSADENRDGVLNGTEFQHLLF